MRWTWIAAFALAVLVLAPGLDRVGLLDEREARNAVVAHELLLRREALTPLLGGLALHERPIAAYLPDLAANPFDTGSPLPARLVRAGLAIALVLLGGIVAGRHFGGRAGGLAAAVLATTAGLPYVARTDGGVLLAALLGWIACAAFAELLFRAPRRPGLARAAAWLALAAAVQVGGPMSALWPLAGLALFARLARRPETWRRVQPLPGLVVVIALSLPWYGAMVERHGFAFVAELPAYPFGAGPSPGSLLARLGMPFAAVTMLVAGGFPWSAILPGAAVHAATWWRSRGRRSELVGMHDDSTLVLHAVEDQVREESAAHLLLAWLACALIPAALVYRPPIAAALPALPALAALIGRLLDHALESPERVREPLHAGTRMLALIGVPLAILATMAANRLPDAAAPLRLLSAVLVVVACAPALAAFMGRTRLAALLFAAPVALAAPIVGLRVLPALEDALGTRTVGEALRAAAPERAPLVLLEPPPSSLRFYAPRQFVVSPALAPGRGVERGAGAVPSREAPPANVDALATALERFRAADSTTYVAFRPWRENAVLHAASGTIEILARTPALVLARVHREPAPLPPAR